MKLPLALPNYNHIRRFWDEHRKIAVAKIHPGEIYVSSNDELISTLLGSCISVCIRDSVNNIGGMNHYKLPSPGRLSTASDLNFGSYAMEQLINEILKNGGQKRFLEAKIFGGGSVTEKIQAKIGEKNQAFVLGYLKREKIKIVLNDTGHKTAQTIYFHPITGKTFSIVQGALPREQLRAEEQAYLSRVKQLMSENSITYF